MSRDTTLRTRLALQSFDMTVDLYLYPTESGGKRLPIQIGWGCPCFKDKRLSQGWDGYPLLQDEMLPGERRRVGYFFLSGQEAVAAFASCDRFYLWEGSIIGEAAIIKIASRGAYPPKR